MMSPSSRMGDEQTFQQLWEFRRKDNDFDTSSDDSKSNSTGEPVIKEHNLVSGMISLDNDKTGNIGRLQQNHNYDPDFEGQSEFGKAKEKKTKKIKKNHLAKREMKRHSHEEVNRKKSKTGAHDPATVDVKSFRESLLEDLKATRENLFTWMREEINKLAADDNGPRRRRKGASGNKKVQHQKNFGKDLKFQPQNNSEDSAKEQNLNRNEAIIHMQQKNNFEEDIEVLHQNNYEKDNQVQRQNNFESGMRAPNCSGESLERFVKSTEAADANGPCQALDDQVDYAKEIASRRSIDKEKGKRLSLTAKSKVQSSSFDQNVEMQHPKSIVLAIRAQNCDNGSSKRSKVSKKTADSNKLYQVPEERVGFSQAMGSMASHEKNKAKGSKLPVEQNLSPNPSDQVASSTYLTLPTVLTDSPDLNSKIDTSLCNYIQRRVAGNKTSLSLERANQMFDFSAHFGYPPNVTPEERRDNFAQTGSRNMSHFDQNGVPSSSTGTDFPVPFHQNMGGGFSIPGQFCSQNLSQENCNPLGLRMNGGAVAISGESYGFSNHLFANNLRHANYETASRLMPYQIPSISDGYLFPKQFKRG